jgi:hypothetical protein
MTKKFCCPNCGEKDPDKFITRYTQTAYQSMTAKIEFTEDFIDCAEPDPDYGTESCDNEECDGTDGQDYFCRTCQHSFEQFAEIDEDEDDEDEDEDEDDEDEAIKRADLRVYARSLVNQDLSQTTDTAELCRVLRKLMATQKLSDLATAEYTEAIEMVRITDIKKAISELLSE